MVQACLGLLAGMYALQLSSFANASDYLGVPLVAVICLLAGWRNGFVAWFAVGASLFYLAAMDELGTRLPRSLEGDSIVVEVIIVDFPRRRDAGSTFVAETRGDTRVPRRVRLSWYGAPVTLRLGDRWRLEVRLRRPRGSRNAGGFDYEAWLFRQRIGAVGYVVPGRRTTLLLPEASHFVDAVRARFERRVAAQIGDPSAAAVLTALVIGARHRLTDAQWDRFARTGTSHLMAISGLHIGLAAAGSYFLLLLLAGVLRTAGNAHRFAVTGGLLIATGYAQLAGFAVPAARASLMLLVMCIALLRRRPGSLPEILSFACMAMAIFDPLATMQPGFMLSFSAVAILVWLARRRRAGLLSAQFMLLFGMLPLGALLFDRIVTAAIPVNLLAIPLFSFVTVPLALAGFVLDGIFEPAGSALLRLAAASITGLERLLAAVAATEWSALSLPGIDAMAWFYLLLPAGWVVLPRGWPGRQTAWLGMLAMLVYAPRSPEPGCVSVHVLDVGQGLAVVVRTASRTLLYDTGPAYRNGSSAARHVVLPFLRDRGIHEIDELVISHADLDHAGGSGDIRQAIPVQRSYAGEPLAQRATPCRSNQSWQADGVDFQFLGPPLAPYFAGNDASCVLLVTAGRRRILLSGDIERPAEEWLARQRMLPRADAVVVPHHGSRTSSSSVFVQALRPELAIVSAAYGNRWGLPRPEIVQRWQSAGARVLNTATSGAIELRLCKDGRLVRIGEYRRDKRRIWHEL